LIQKSKPTQTVQKLQFRVLLFFLFFENISQKLTNFTYFQINVFSPKKSKLNQKLEKSKTKSNLRHNEQNLEENNLRSEKPKFQT